MSAAVSARLLDMPKSAKGYIFGSYKSQSGHITRQTAWKWFKKAALEARVDIAGCSPHSLRKSFAAELRHKEGLHAVQEALQHSNSFTTAIYAYADVYAGYDPEAPILWGQIEELLDLIVEHLCEKTIKNSKKRLK
jgi:integrase